MAKPLKPSLKKLLEQKALKTKELTKVKKPSKTVVKTDKSIPESTVMSQISNLTKEMFPAHTLPDAV